MKRLVFSFVWMCIPLLAAAQLVKPEQHDFYLNTLNSAKDSSFNEIIRLYDAYLEKNPSDFLVHIEKCKVIDLAYYDSYEEYNPKYEEFEACLQDLARSFPKEPEVLIFKSNYVYGDSTEIFLMDVVTQYEENPGRWNGKGIWKIYEHLARHYDTEEGTSHSIHYATLALDQNDTLDLSLLLATQYQKQKKIEEAIRILEAAVDSTDESYILNQKGRLLLELGAAEKALIAFRFAGRDTTSWVDGGSLAQALIENGLSSEARPYLVKEAANTWTHPQSLQKLLEYDMRYSDGDSARATYIRMVDESFWYDALGIYRLELLWYAPLQGWSLGDIGRLLMLVLLILLVFLIPYLWILPIYSLGTYLKKGNPLTKNSDHFRWTLRHFWIISSCWLGIDILAELVFNYPDLIQSYTSLSYSEVVQTVSRNQASFALFFFTASATLTALFIRRCDLVLLWGTRFTPSESILKGIGAAFLLKFCAGLYGALLKISDLLVINPASFLTVNESILAINKYYHPVLGFLFVVILVPIYEEIMFRGIILSAIEKHLKFNWANTIQAALFATIHMQWVLFPFFFAFGIVCGIYRNKSQSLGAGIALHITNNLIAFLYLLWLGDRSQFWQ